MIPPRKAEGEVDLKEAEWGVGGAKSAKLSALELHLLRLVGSSLGVLN